MYTSETMEKKAREYNSLREQAQEIEKKLKALRADFEAQTEDHEPRQYGAWSVKWTERNTTRVDSKRLFEEHPEINKSDYETTSKSYAIALSRN